MADTETAAVTVTLLQLETLPPRSMGRTTHLAVVEVEVGGVAWTIQGVRVVRRPDGSLQCMSPSWRHPSSGKPYACVELPLAISDCIAAEVIAACEDAPGQAPGGPGTPAPPPDPRGPGALLRKTAGHA